MQFAIVGKNKHQRPKKGLKGKCPFCGEELIAKCGNIKVHHWSHSTKSECPYKENKGPWHINWQNNFSDDWQEYLMLSENGEKNIADIRTPGGFVIEFQHSHIRDDELYQRESFYKNMVWVVDASNWKRIFSFFEEKFKDKQVEKIKLFNFEYDFSSIWENSNLPVFYDLSGIDKQVDNSWKNYLYCVFPEKEIIGRYIIPINKQDFIELVKKDKLDNWINNLQKEIDIEYNEEIERRQEEKQILAEKLRQEKEERQREKEITHKNAIPKAKYLNDIFNDIKNQREYTYNFYKEIDTFNIKLKFLVGLKFKLMEDILNPQYNKLNTDYCIECSNNSYLYVDNIDIKNCNIRDFCCCPSNGKSLNDYYKNINKNKLFFTGQIGKDNFKKVFSGKSIVVIINRKNESISVLCRNFINGKKQNNYSLIHIIYKNNIYYHFQYYSTENIDIFLKMVCNNNFITVNDIKKLD